MRILDKIYTMSPIFFQNLMVTMAGHQKNKQRYGKIYWDHRKFLIDFDTWDLKKKQAYQNQELVKFVHFAAEKSLFYQKLYADASLDDLKSIQDLKKLPTVDKELLRQHIKEVMTISEVGAIKEKTGGTTGKSLIVLRTVADMMKRMAMLDHFKARVGFENRKMSRATFNAKPIVPPKQQKKVFWRYNAAGKQMIYTPFRLSEENMPHYVDSLNKFKPQSLDGFLSSLCDIAAYIKKEQLSLTFTPIAIFPTSETLTKSNRELLESVFGCKVYDQYASSEGAPFVTECEYQRLHMELASGVFEHFEKESTEVLVTSFTTHGTPLIRYQIGDAMVLTDQETSNCPCGNSAPIVKEIQGRKTDFLYTSEGVKVSAATVSGLFKNLGSAVIKTQVIQNEIHEITILLEVDKKKYLPIYDKQLTEEFQRRFGVGTRLMIKHVDELPKEKSGKFRMIKNNVSV